MNPAPIILFVYNRPDHTRQTIEALQKNELAKASDLFIYSDGPEDTHQSNLLVSEVREYIKDVKRFSKINIIENKTNSGLANSIINGVSQIINKYGKAIVLEDDIITAPSFLKFMNESLSFYENTKKIYSITGYNLPPKVMKIPKSYSHDVYFNPRAHSWGWATWSDRWNKADWGVSCYDSFISDKKAIKKFNIGGTDLSPMLAKQMAGTIDSWAVRWCFTHFLENAYSVYPTQSLVTNIGFDGSGVHCNPIGESKFNNDLSLAKKHFKYLSNIELDNRLLYNFRSAYDQRRTSKIFRWLWSTVMNI